MKDIQKFIDAAKANLEMLKRISGQDDFKTIRIVGDTIPARWCPEVRRKISSSDLPIILVSGGGTGAVNAVAARVNLGIGSIGTQDFDNVNITGGSIAVSGQFNTGVVLPSDCYSTSKISVRSSLVDFLRADTTQVFTVPADHFFLLDEMEIVTSSISSPREAPIVSFGNSAEPNAYYGPSKSESNMPESRHTIERRQDAIWGGTSVVFRVEETSTADEHFGFCLVTGYLMSGS